MEKTKIVTPEEQQLINVLYEELNRKIQPFLEPGDRQMIAEMIVPLVENGQLKRDVFGLHPMVTALQTAIVVVDEIGLRRDAVMAILLRQSVEQQLITLDTVAQKCGLSVGRILGGLCRIKQLYENSPIGSQQSARSVAELGENFRNLLLSMAEDMRVILIMIADRVNLMRQILKSPKTTTQPTAEEPTDTDADHSLPSLVDYMQEVSQEAAYLYAPLAHKLGLYQMKSELEDLSLKYLEHDAYYHIKEKLSATKRSRDAYIERFIGPIQQKLTEAGLVFHMKGRTKSIHSIWQKMKKQKCPFEGVYDLFAIRIIIDCPIEKEKMQCWQAYSIVTDMYQPNPKRLRDWLSVPKLNGYESLHITVLGPEQKWVEVQIRTERMDEVAEKGVAAHWRYKGVKAEGGMDDWLAGIRQMLESATGLEAMDQLKMDLEAQEVYVFTPKGDLLKFPKGATVLDMAYHIHTKVGSACTGARINNRVVTFRHELRSGDQVEIMTSNQQYPKQEWLQIVKTSRAKAKIRLALKESQQKEALMVKEMLERRLHNRKLDFEEGAIARTMKALGYKVASDFYRDIAAGTLDPQKVIDKYQEITTDQRDNRPEPAAHSAEEFVLDSAQIAASQGQGGDDVLVIDSNLKGIDYQLAHCCHPIYGDDVFGFVTSGGGIKIHRTDCPNAAEMRRRFGYRIVKAKWSGKGTSQYSITLRVIGNDDLGIVNNLTSIISKDEKLLLRSINIDSNDGIFRGTLVVMMTDNSRLQALMKKLRTVKGVKQVERI